jgi:hypothetical protein
MTVIMLTARRLIGRFNMFMESVRVKVEDKLFEARQIAGMGNASAVESGERTLKAEHTCVGSPSLT